MQGSDLSIRCTATSCAINKLGNKGERNGESEGLFYGFPHGGFRRRAADQAQEDDQEGRDRGDRHGWEVRRHQAAFRRVGQRQLSSSQLRAGRGRPGQGAGRQALPDRLQHHVSGQAQERPGAPGVRLGKRVLADVGRVSHPDRGRAEGDRRYRGACRGRGIREGSQDRAGRHGCGRVHQPDPFQGARDDWVRPECWPCFRVRDMWLTGFDAPCLHTMYADKPMQGHGLMQAIARVNRVFRDKPGGLVVDYLGLADQLKHALANYTESGGKGDPTFDTRQAIAVMLEKHNIACDIMHGFNWELWTTGKPSERLALIPAGQEHILSQDDGKKRWVQVVTELSRAFALCAASDEATEIREDVSFFQALQAALNKQCSTNRKTPEQIDAAIRQLVSKAITTEGQVIDVFTAAGCPK